MSRWFSYTTCLGLTAAVLAFCAPAPARAAFAIKFDAGSGGSTVVNDGDPGDTSNISNSISYSGQVGSFAVQIASSLSDSPGGELGAQLTLDFNSIRNLDLNNSHTITITASATDYTQPRLTTDMFSTLNAAFQVNNDSGDTVTIQSYFNRDNTLFSTAGTPTAPYTFSRASGRAGASTSDITDGLTFGQAYSLTTVITLTLGPNLLDTNGNYLRAAGASARLDINGSGIGAPPPVVPAPAGLVLAASAAPLLGLFGLRRRQPAQTA